MGEETVKKLYIRVAHVGVRQRSFDMVILEKMNWI